MHSESIAKQITYLVTSEGILCLLCGRTSVNPHDIEEKFCGHCGVHHQDVSRVLDLIRTSVLETTEDENDRVPVDEHGFFARRLLDDGRELAVMPLLFGRGRLGISATSIESGSQAFEDVWDYLSLAAAVHAMHEWANAIESARGDATPQIPTTPPAEPDGWNRHLRTRRYRPEGDPAREYVKAAQ